MSFVSEMIHRVTIYHDSMRPSGSDGVRGDNPMRDAIVHKSVAQAFNIVVRRFRRRNDESDAVVWNTTDTALLYKKGNMTLVRMSNNPHSQLQPSSRRDTASARRRRDQQNSYSRVTTSSMSSIRSTAASDEESCAISAVSPTNVRSSNLHQMLAREESEKIKELSEYLKHPASRTNEGKQSPTSRDSFFKNLFYGICEVQPPRILVRRAKELSMPTKVGEKTWLFGLFPLDVFLKEKTAKEYRRQLKEEKRRDIVQKYHIGDEDDDFNIEVRNAISQDIQRESISRTLQMFTKGMNARLAIQLLIWRAYFIDTLKSSARDIKKNLYVSHHKEIERFAPSLFSRSKTV